jgi:hypothetical protein
LFDGIVPPGDDFAGFLEELMAAAKEMGEPFFLRTDHTSAKHSWEETCFVKSTSDLMQHVY